MKKVVIRRWEGALMAGFAFALLLPLIGGRAQEQLAEKVIRLHIIAHSDSPEDQALKLSVRDAVLAYVGPLGCDGGLLGSMGADAGPLGSDEGPLGADAGPLGAVKEAIRGHGDQIRAVAEAEVARQGYDYPVTVSLEDNVVFPTREYDGFSLPAGEYTALRVVIGDGAGKNWWCVVFPPLCMASASDGLTQAAAVGSLDGEDVALITESGPEYVLKFKAAEWWQGLQDWLG